MRLLKPIAVTLLVCLAVTLVYGVMIEPRLILDEERHQVEIPGLPSGWQGREIAVFSDLQVGAWLANTAMAERIVDRVVEAEPAAVLYAGDFLYSTDPSIREQTSTVVDLLGPLIRSGIPTYAVLGNHDYEKPAAADALDRELERNGIAVLRNESAQIAGPETDEPLYVVGIGPETPDLSDVGAALTGVPANAPRIVLMHNPTTFPALPAGAAPLAVAGHTHCGQIALPISPQWTYLGLTDEEARVAEGFAFEGYGAPGNRLFVTCGVGFSLLPVRINAPPQLVFFELVAS